MPFPEISVRLKSNEKLYNGVKIATSMDVAFLIGEEIASYKEGTMAILNMNAAGQAISMDIGPAAYFKGNARETIKRSILSNAAFTIMASNGADSPEKQELTKQYGTAYSTVGISLMDHVCKAHGGSYHSYRNNGEPLMHDGTAARIVASAGTGNERPANEREHFVRLKTRTLAETEGISTKEAAIEHVAKEIQQLDREAIYIICNDESGKPASYSLISMGNLDCSLLTGREAFKAPILTNASSVIMMHNHPSGNASPSNADHTSTEMIHAAGKILGIPLEDHVIVSDKEQYSFREHGKMPGQDMALHQPEQPKFKLKKTIKAYSEPQGKQSTALDFSGIEKGGKDG